jgi:hypothetical protein
MIVKDVCKNASTNQGGKGVIMQREAIRSRARGYELQAMHASLLAKLHTCTAVMTQLTHCGTENCLEIF